VIQTVFRVMLLALLRDRGALALAFILPPLIFVIFATVFAGASGNELEIAMAVADEAKTPAAHELVKALRASTVLRIADEALSADEVRSRVKHGTADVGVVVRADPVVAAVASGEAPIIVIADRGRAIAGAIALGQTQRALVGLMREAGAVPGGDLVVFEEIAGSGKGVGKIAYSAGAVAILFILLSAVQNATSIIDERQSGIVDRLLVGPGGTRVLVLGKFEFLVVLGLAQCALIFLVAWLGYRVDVPGHIGPLMVLSCAASIAAAGLALAVTTACRTRQQAHTVSSFVVLILSAIGGSMIPRFFMPGWLQRLGWFTPNAWAIEGYQAILWRDEPASAIALPSLVLAGAGALMLAIALVTAHRFERT